MLLDGEMSGFDVKTQNWAFWSVVEGCYKTYRPFTVCGRPLLFYLSSIVIVFASFNKVLT